MTARRHPVVKEDLAWIQDTALPWGDLEGSTVLISGVYGFLPAYLAEALLFHNEVSGKAPITVLGIGRNEEKARKRFAAYEGREDFRLLRQDVCDPVEMDGPVEYVVHAASWASPKYYGSDPIGTMAPNLFGTHRLLQLAQAKHSRSFLFFSSAETYGQADPEHLPTPESYRGSVDAMDVRSCYAESKRMGETMCVSWHHQHGVPTRSLRIFHTYGPGMALDDGRVFADFVSDIVARRDIRMKSDGSALRAYCYLADAVGAMLTVLLKGSDGAAYNMGNEDAEVSVLDLAETLVAQFPERNLKVVRAEQQTDGYLPTQVNRACPDTSRLRALGWKPRFGVAEGFRRTILSFEEPEPERRK